MPGPVRSPSLSACCARSGEGSQHGNRHFQPSAGRCCDKGQHGAGSPTESRPNLAEKEMPGSAEKVVAQGKCVQATRHGGEQPWWLCGRTYGGGGCGREGPDPGKPQNAHSGPGPQTRSLSAQCELPHQDGPHQGHPRATGCSFISMCSSPSITVS